MRSSSRPLAAQWIFIGFFCSGHASAFLSDDLWRGTSASSSDSPVLDIRLNLESVGDSVDYAPNLEVGSYAKAERQQRYQSFSIDADWKVNPLFRMISRLQKRALTSKRDKFELYAYSLALHYSLPINSNNKQYSVSLGVAGNTVSELDKNSYSHFEEKLLTSVQIIQPYDIQIQANIAATLKLSPTVYWSLQTGLGHVVTGHSSIIGIGKSRDGCMYRFETGDGVGSLRQIGPCGDVLQFSQEYPDYEAVKENLGFDPEKDISSQMGYVQMGSSLSKAFGNGRYSVAYYYQQWDRGEFDNRIRQRGGSVVTTNQTFAARLDYRLSTRWGLGFQVEYQQRQLLNQLPVLYTGVTSDRFSDDALLFSLSATYSFHRRGN